MNERLVASRLAAHGVLADPDRVGDVVSWSFSGDLYPVCLKLDKATGQLMLRIGPLAGKDGRDVIASCIASEVFLTANQHLPSGRFAGVEESMFEDVVKLTGDKQADVECIDGLLQLADLVVCTDAFDESVLSA